MVYRETFQDIYLIEVGRTALENDRLVEEANKTSMWFHVSDSPSPHGILTNTKTPATFSQEAINRCAELVKSYSKSKKQCNVKIDCIIVAYVQRTNKLGMVILSQKPKKIVV